jgi:AcrR family transcriptional regulator
MQDPTPRERRHLRTRDAILDAARLIIQESGSEKLSMRAIARHIDYSPAGLYEYFGSKDEIIAAVCEQGHDRFSLALASVDTALPPDDYLIALGLAYLQFARNNPGHYLLMFTNQAPKAKTPTDSIEPDSTFNILVRGIERGVEAGIYHVTDTLSVLSMAYTMWGNAHGLAMLRIAHMSHVALDFDRLELESITTLVAGLKRR